MPFARIGCEWPSAFEVNYFAILYLTKEGDAHQLLIKQGCFALVLGKK